MATHQQVTVCLRRTLTSRGRKQVHSTIFNEGAKVGGTRRGISSFRFQNGGEQLYVPSRHRRLSTMTFSVPASNVRSRPGAMFSIRMASTTVDHGSSNSCSIDGTGHDISSTTSPAAADAHASSYEGSDMLATTGYATEISEDLTLLTMADVSEVMTHFQEVAAALVASSPPCPSAAVALSTVAALTANSMIPFLPVQPSVVATASQLGIWAYPFCVTGQTLGGVLAFSGARFAANSDIVKWKTREFVKDANEEAVQKLKHFKELGSKNKESTQFLALMAIRLTPFFPFASGNYLLGSVTAIGLRPFALATFLGCCVSQTASVGIGMGGAEIVKHALLM